MELGPYSALFDYKDELAKAEALKQQRAESQKKIMRTNALGDAFRLLADGIGGAKGATITKKPINPGIMGASARLNALDNTFDSKAYQIKMMDLNTKTKDIEYQKAQKWHQDQLDAQKKAREDQTAELKAQREDRADALKAQREYIAAVQGIKFENLKANEAAKINAAETAFSRRRSLMGYQSELDMKETDARIAATMKANAGKIPRGTKTSDKDIEFITPDTGETIYIKPSQIDQMVYRLQQGKTKFDLTLDPMIKDLMSDKAIKQPSTILALKNNWDRIKDVLPEFYDPQAEVNYAKDRSVMQSLGYNTGDTYRGLAPNQPAYKAPAAATAPTSQVPAQTKISTKVTDISQGTQDTITMILDKPGDKRKKRSAVFDYLIKSGVSEDEARPFAEYLYSKL
jgi:hypothetical protein